MSGRAAKEIQEMLIQSTRSVEEVAERTRKNVSDLIRESRQKIEHGLIQAQSCGEIFGKISNILEDFDYVITEISIAGHEQNQCIEGIVPLLNGLDKISQKNATMAKSISDISEKLAEQSNSINKSIGQLESITRQSNSEQETETGNVVALRIKTKAQPSHTEDTERLAG